MKKRIVTILLIAILLIGSVLRFWQLGNVPISPDWDEVALAYEAQSIYLTGKDTFGEFLPPVLRSFDDYKPALYAYFAIPSVELFGLTTFAVRLPSAIFGIIAIFVLHLLVKELFFKEEKTKKYAETIALLSAFLLAISPWHLQFSRTAFETNIGLTFNLLFALFFIKGLKKPWFLLLAALFAGLNFSVYQSERVFTPLLALGLVLIYRSEFFRVSKKYLVSAVLIGLMTIVPLGVYISNHPQALIRVKATSIFAMQTDLLKDSIDKLHDDTVKHDIVGQVMDNRRVIFAKEITASYLVHYDPRWLFLSGDINRHHAPRMGLLFFITLPFILFGIYHLIFGKYDKKTKYFIFFWFLIAPIPAAITFEVPHAVRTLNVVPMYQIFTAVGVIAAFELIRKHKLCTKAAILGVGLLTLGNVVYFLNQYFVQQNYFYAADWQYGYEKAVKEVTKIDKEYKKVVVSDKQPMDKSYMFFIFYLQYPPQEYQKLGEKSGSFDSTHAFGNYEFRPFNWDSEKKNKDVLYVGSVNDFPETIISRKVIYNPDGKPAILIVDPEENL